MEAPFQAVGATLAGAAATSAALRWARRRCDEALADARMTLLPGERREIRTATLRPGLLSRDEAAALKALQGALATPARLGAPVPWDAESGRETG